MSFDHRPPTDGRGLYRWAREVEDHHGCGMVHFLRQVGKRRGYPPRIVAWDADQVAQAYEAASTALARYLR